MRLEIRRENLASQQLFLRHGYAVLGEHADYYEDGMDALRLEKKAKKGVERLEKSHDWKLIQHWGTCTGGGTWKVKW